MVDFVNYSLVGPGILMKFSVKSPFALLAVVAVALALVMVLIKSKQPLQHTGQRMPSKAVEIITVANIPYRTKVTGYGNVVPAITLNSMAEVSGKISYIHASLKAGETIPAGTVVARIDPQDYTVQLKQTEADLAASRSQLTQLQEEEKTTQRSLELAKENLAVGEKEYARVKDVYEKELVSKSALDAEEQKVIGLRQSVEELQGKMNGYASRRQSIEAQIERAEREVENSKTRLGRTEIVLPFDARIGRVNIEKNEFVAVGTELFEATDLQGVEISAQLPISTMRKLVTNISDKSKLQPLVMRTGGSIADQLNLSAKVRLVNRSVDAVWDAKVLRISESIDQTRQTIGVVVGVENPYEKVIPGRRPPLIQGMYTSVELYTQGRDALVIPRNAIHEGRVYLANSDDKLEIRPVRVLYTQDDLAVIETGLSPGERVIVTDLFPVIEGMPLQITEATDLAERLKRQASGAI